MYLKGVSFFIDKSRACSIIISVLTNRDKPKIHRTCSLYAKQIQTKFTALMNAMMARYDLSESQGRILMFLYRHQEEVITPSLLCKTYDLSGATITGLLNRLEKKELIEYHPNPKDKRIKQVSISEKGKNKVECIQSEIGSLDNKMTEGLSDKEIQQFMQMCEVMLTNLRKEGKCHD